MKVLSVVGARPQFVKLAAMAGEFADYQVEHLIVHTGQHYDEMMSESFFRELGIPAPDEHLGVGSGSHGVQTGSMLASLEQVFERHLPDWVLVYGDTNSTLAAAIAAVKLHLPVAHLEAGLRSFNRRMPEEHNRVLTDHAADLCLAPSDLAVRRLAAEGLGERTVEVGDIMTDVLFRTRDIIAERSGIPDDGPLVATIHRAENTDDPERLRAILHALDRLDRPVRLYAHPRLTARAKEFGIRFGTGALDVRPPASYPELIAAVMAAPGVVTDSGGLQKEAFLLRVPCTTVRTETEWPETVETGWNALTEPAGLASAVSRPSPPATDATPYGTGDTARRVREALELRMPGR